MKRNEVVFPPLELFALSMPTFSSTHFWVVIDNVSTQIAIEVIHL